MRRIRRSAVRASSRSIGNGGVSINTWLSENTESKRVTFAGGISKMVRNVPDREEAEAAATTLPSMDVGQYGHIQSAEVASVVGPREMVVRNVWIVDGKAITEARLEETKKVDEYLRKQEELLEAERRKRSSRTARREPTPTPRVNEKQLRQEIEKRFKHRTEAIERQRQMAGSTVRLLGVPTAGAIPGMRWTPSGASRHGLQIAIVGEDEGAVTASSAGRPSSLIGSRTGGKALVAVDARRFLERLEESDVVDLLARRGMTPADFVTTARDIMMVFRKIQVMIREEGGAAQVPNDPLDYVVQMLEKAGKKKREAAAEALVGPSGTPAAGTPARVEIPEGDDWFIRKTPRPSRD